MNIQNKSNIDKIYPLSPMQEGLLFRSLYTSSDQYLVQEILHLSFTLQVELFKQSWQKVIEQYDILRTGFLWDGIKKPIQFVLKSIIIPFKEINLSLDFDNQFKNLIDADREELFDLTVPPIFRVTVIQKSFEDFYIIWSRHHILLDGWCSNTIISQVLLVY